MKIFNRHFSITEPLFTAFSIFILFLLFAFGYLLSVKTGAISSSDELLWTAGAGFILLYSVACCFTLFNTEEYGKQAIKILLGFLLLMIAVVFSTTLLSGVGLLDVEGYRGLFTVLFVVNMFIIGVGLFLRQVYDWLSGM